MPAGGALGNREQGAEAPEYAPNDSTDGHGGAYRHQSQQAKVLAMVLIDAAESHAVDGGSSAGTGEVRDLGVRDEADAMPPCVQSFLPVGFFHVHEESFVKTAHILNYRLSHQ